MLYVRSLVILLLFVNGTEEQRVIGAGVKNFGSNSLPWNREWSRPKSEVWKMENYLNLEKFKKKGQMTTDKHEVLKCKEPRFAKVFVVYVEDHDVYVMGCSKNKLIKAIQQSIYAGHAPLKNSFRIRDIVIVNCVHNHGDTNYVRPELQKTREEEAIAAREATPDKFKHFHV